MLGSCYFVCPGITAAAAGGYHFSADHISTQNSYAIGQEEGGAYNIAIAYLTAWQGPVTEEMDPYGDGVTPEGLSPVKHVQEVQIAEDKDFDAIKE